MPRKTKKEERLQEMELEKNSQRRKKHQEVIVERVVMFQEVEVQWDIIKKC